MYCVVFLSLENMIEVLASFNVLLLLYSWFFGGRSLFYFAYVSFVQLSIIGTLISVQGSKRSRTGVTESLSTATNVAVQDAYMSDFGSMEVNNSAITGVGNEPIGSYWDWDDDDRGMEMDIQALLSEFGDFGDFFENDVLPFGEVSDYIKRIPSFVVHSFLLKIQGCSKSQVQIVMSYMLHFSPSISISTYFSSVIDV